MRCALGADGEADPLSQWRRHREIVGDAPEKQIAELTAALSGGSGFPDFFLLPELPGASGVGYVALLRFIRPSTQTKSSPATLTRVSTASQKRFTVWADLPTEFASPSLRSSHSSFPASGCRLITRMRASPQRRSPRMPSFSGA
jgi:hypothetical protein